MRGPTTRTGGAFLLILAAASAAAQAPVGPEFRVNEVTAGDQLLTAVAADAAGNLPPGSRCPRPAPSTSCPTGHGRTTP
jgi:hypothetical protein